MEDGVESNIFKKLRTFKYIYLLYFLADILYILSMLSRLFQNKFVDITTIGSVVKTDIAQIRMLFIDKLVFLFLRSLFGTSEWIEDRTKNGMRWDT